MLKSTLKKSSSALGALMLTGALALPTASVADQIVLKSADGTVNVEGEFVAFDDNNYIIRTNLGEFRISADRVRCEGEACPTFDIASADITIKGSDTVGLGMMPLLLDCLLYTSDAADD